jgi:hypothetical protein
MAVTDLSALADGALSMGSSMSAGNTLAEPGPFSPPGSPSEQTTGPQVHDRPELELGEQQDYAQFIPADDDAHADFTWSRPGEDSDGWTMSRG